MMSDDKGLTVSNGTIRKLVAAAVCDMAAYVSTSKDPFITGGQYSNKMLLDRIRMWCFDRQLDLGHPEKASEVWLSLCSQGLLKGDKTFDHPPKPINQPFLPPNPKPPKLPPKPPSGEQYKDRDQNDSPAGGLDEEAGDDWKDKKDRKKDWRDEGEDWKKEPDDET